MEGFSVFELAELTVDELVLAAQTCEADNTRAMNELVRRLSDSARRISATVCHHAADRDDVANAALMAIPRVARAFCSDRGRPFTPYVTTAMYNEARRESMRLTGQRNPRDVVAAAEMTRVLHLERDRDVIERGALPFGSLGPALAALPDMELEAVLLIDLGYSGREIAARTGVQAPAISKRLSSAHSRLRASLGAAA